MKKTLVFLLALALVGVAFAADEKTLEQRVADLEAKKVVVPAYSGSVEFKWADTDTASAPQGIGTFSTTTTGAVGSIALSVASDHVSAGATIGLVPTITKTSAASTASVKNNADLYAISKKAMEWYEAKKTKAGMGTINWDTVLAGLTNVWVGGKLVEPKDSFNQVLVNEYIAAYTAINTAVRNAIDNILASVTMGTTNEYGKFTLSDKYTDTGVDTYQIFYDNAKFDTITATEKASWNGDDGELTLLKAYVEYAVGVAGSDSWAASYPVSAAFLKFTKLFDVVDLTCEVNGTAVSVGSLVTSKNTKGDANLGLTVGLSAGVVPGVSASVLINESAGKAKVGDNYKTYANEIVAGEEPVFGFQFNGGYAMADIGLSVKAAFGATDLNKFADTMVFSLVPSITLKDVFGLSIGGEFNMNKGLKGMGAGATVGAKIMGISPAVKFLWKDANFYGDDTKGVSGSDTIKKDGTLAAEFASIDLASAAALDLAVSVDLAELMGMKLVTLSGGYQMMLIGATESGWNVGLGLDLNAVAAMPIVVAASASQYGTAKGAGAFSVAYTFEKAVVTGAVNLSEDFKTIGYSVGAKVAF